MIDPVCVKTNHGTATNKQPH